MSTTTRMEGKTNGDRNGGHDLLDHLRVAHAGDTTVSADVGGDTLEGLWDGKSQKISNTRRKRRKATNHDGASSGTLSDDSLLDIDDVHCGR
jgi:hypothetical protein